jgi:hypothetical protein
MGLKHMYFIEVIHGEPNPTQQWLPVSRLVHLSDKFVDIIFPVTKVSTFNIMLKLARPPAAGRIRKFERPKEV